MLREELVVETLKEVRKRLHDRAASSVSELGQLEKQARALRVEVDNLVNALARTVDKPQPILDAISERSKRLKALESRVDAAKMAPSMVDLETRRMEEEAKAPLAELKALLDRNPEEARKAIGALLPEPLTFKPIGEKGGRRFQIEGVTEAGVLFTAESPPLQPGPNGGAQCTDLHVPNANSCAVNAGKRSSQKFTSPRGSVETVQRMLEVAVDNSGVISHGSSHRGRTLPSIDGPKPTSGA